jgi:maltooligosyltrehalose trehalohydrolase
MSTILQRRLPIGAEPGEGGVHFRIWAPRRSHMEVVIEGSHAIRLEREPEGYFSKTVEGAAAGTRYRFRLDHEDRLLPDPASRYQPEGPHGPSQVVCAQSYLWTDGDWKGTRIEGQVIYEIHIGTFTLEGTWNAAREELPRLARTGITLVEIMPVAEFTGSFGWGYDGVDLFAPTHVYGTPDDFRSFVNHAHGLGLGVILDVVYNHLGPDGNYLPEFSNDYFTRRYVNEWGEAVDFDGPNSAGVRQFFIANAKYWIEEFHLDGLRFDATQQMFDNSSDHIIAAITREARRAAGRKSIVMIAENERQNARLARDAKNGGYGLDAIWNDDFHHAARVALTGHNEAYYSDYSGTPQELISATKWGFLFQGQYHTWQRKQRGSYAFDLKPASFVNFIQNHDQVANTAYGSRIQNLTTFGRYKAITALMLLGPATPMLFQGQEYGASSPFLYFADQNRELAILVEKGRAEFLQQFRSIDDSHLEFAMGLPSERGTFEKCKLDPGERERNLEILSLHQDLLKLRRDDPVFRAQRSDWLHGAVLGSEAFALRFFGGIDGERLLVVNLGRTVHLKPAAEPLLAPPRSGRWETAWTSEDPKYRGSGSVPVRKAGTWNIPGHCAVVMYEGRTGD